MARGLHTYTCFVPLRIRDFPEGERDTHNDGGRRKEHSGVQCSGIKAALPLLLCETTFRKGFSARREFKNQRRRRRKQRKIPRGAKRTTIESRMTLSRKRAICRRDDKTTITSLFLSKDWLRLFSFRMSSVFFPSLCLCLDTCRRSSR